MTVQRLSAQSVKVLLSAEELHLFLTEPAAALEPEPPPASESITATSFASAWERMSPCSLRSFAPFVF